MAEHLTYYQREIFRLLGVDLPVRLYTVEDIVRLARSAASVYPAKYSLPDLVEGVLRETSVFRYQEFLKEFSQIQAWEKLARVPSRRGSRARGSSSQMSLI